MHRVFLDFETYYENKTYTLKSLSPVEYILHPRWETLGCGVAIEHEPAFLLPKDDVAPFLRGFKQPYAAITHNALFDACILAFRYGIHPAALLCTLSMARATVWHSTPNGRLSLKELLKYLELPQKTDFIQQMSGKHYADLEKDPGLLMGWTGYTLNDVEGCREIFFRLRKDFPGQEALVMDRVIRMATQPVLHVNMVVLDDYRDVVRQRKRDLLSRISLTDPGQLRSDERFAHLLLQYGVDPPMKNSPTDPHKKIYAFAKTDYAFTDLLEYEDVEVQALVAARLGVKTTIEETRSTRLINIGLCTNSFLKEPLLPVPLKYGGAHTHRYSGDWLLNLQNLSARKSKEIRTAIEAPPGYTIVAVDAAQIEARIVAWLAGEEALLEMFRLGQDTYKAFAAIIFSTPLTQVSKAQRFVGKTCILGLGFGMSAIKLWRTITNLAREQGIEIEITLENCTEWVVTYRSTYVAIWRCWQDMGNLIHAIVNDYGDGWGVGPCHVEGTTIILPSGLKLFYDNLRMEDGEYWYDQAQFRRKLYGAKMLENVVQALDRQHVVEAGLRTEARARELGIDGRVLLNVHDENVHCVPDEQAYVLAEIALEEMRRNEPWCATLPLAAEVKLGKNFGEMEEWKPPQL
jgi:hypothetical protein